MSPRTRTSFPPHSCGGLIEARDFLGEPQWCARFPPHSCGGLIEAICSSEYLKAIPNVFPRIRAGASLKLVLRAMQLRLQLGFSPAFVRGPH